MANKSAGPLSVPGCGADKADNLVIRVRHEFPDVLALHPDDPCLLGDVRYAILPTSARPLWGIRLDLQHPEAHAQFETSRRMSRREIDQFSGMLKGTD